MNFAVVFHKPNPYMRDRDTRMVEGKLFDTRAEAETAAKHVATKYPGTKVYVAETVLCAEVPLTVKTTPR